MSFSKGLIEGVARMIASSHPEYAGIINFALAHEDQIEQAGPLVSAAIKEGPGAFAAAEAKAPELTALIKKFAASIRPAGTAAQHASIAENTTRQLFGFVKMTPSEESALLNRMTPGNDPSQENSKFTVG